MTFEEIMANTIDDDEDYQRFRDEGHKNSLNSLDMGLVFAGHPIRALEDLLVELDQVTQLVDMEVD